jgi:hypothetical protein
MGTVLESRRDVLREQRLGTGEDELVLELATWEEQCWETELGVEVGIVLGPATWGCARDSSGLH